MLATNRSAARTPVIFERTPSPETTAKAAQELPAIGAERDEQHDQLTDRRAAGRRPRRVRGRRGNG
jgi:hypothetical protein